MTKNRRIRIVIVDDNYLIRNGLKTVLDPVSDVNVIGEASSGEEAVKMAISTPDVVLMDIRMPEMSGIDATRQIKKASPGTKVVAFTLSNDGTEIQDMMDAGACGLVSKSDTIETLLDTIRAVCTG